MENSLISWTDGTFNPWEGCTKKSPACLHCYAETLVDTRYGRVKWGKGQPRRRTSPDNWKKPLAWNKSAANFRECLGCGRREQRRWDGMGLSSCSTRGCLALSETESFQVRRRVFCSSLADWLDEEVPIQWLADLLNLIRITPELDWLLLSKRPENWGDRLEDVLRIENESDPRKLTAQVETRGWIIEWLKRSVSCRGATPANIWNGTTIEDQMRAYERRNDFYAIPAVVRFVSYEPALGPVDWTGWEFIDWLISGGESGTHARPSHLGWHRAARDFCAQHGKAYHFKQWGEWKPHSGWDVWKSAPEHLWVHRTTGKIWKSIGRSDEVVGNSETAAEAAEWALVVKAGKKTAGRVFDGRTWDQFPTPAALQPA